MRILIADDDLISRIMLSEILSEYGRCDAAVNGEEVVRAYRLSLFKNKPYDLVCLDIMMPEMDGIEALTKIREIERGNNLGDDKRARIVMVTGLADNMNREKCNAEGCDGVIVKPVVADDLLVCLRELGLIENKA